MTDEFVPTDRPARAASTEGEATAGDYFVLDLDSGRYYSLGEVGGFVWNLLDGEREVSAIAEAVASSFEVSDREATSDVLEFLARLATLGLLEPAAGR